MSSCSVVRYGALNGWGHPTSVALGDHVGQVAQARIVEDVRNARYPNFVAFIATGAILGAIAGGVLSTFSDAAATTFTERSALGYMVVTFGFLGAILGALAAVVADLLITRREGR